MSIYHLNAKIISRGNGSSAVASAAYRSGSKLVDEWVEETKDFTRKKHVVYSDILLPDNAPKEYADREKLWNAVEQYENRSDAQLSRKIEFSLPSELPYSERLKAARELAEYFRKQGMVVDMNIHEPDHECPNPHCHFMMTMRPFKEDGTFVEKKSYREYILDENGEKIPNKNGTDFKFNKVTLYDWDKRDNVTKWRHEWERIENSFYEQNNLDIRVSCESYEAQGIDLIPTIHEGAAVRSMERKGIRTEIGNLNREIKAVNALTIESGKRLSALNESLTNLIYQKNRLSEQKPTEEKKQEQIPNSLIAVLQEWQRGRADFIQEKGIRQKTTTKTGNLKDYSAMVAFLERNSISSIEDLQEFTKKCSSERSDIIHKRNANSTKRKDLDFIISSYARYKPMSKYYATYEAKTGRDKEKFYQEYAEKIEQATAFRNGIMNVCKKTGLPQKISTKQWENTLDELKSEDTALLNRYSEICSSLEKVESIQRAVESVYRTRENEQQKTLFAERSQRTDEGKKKRNEQSI